MQITIIDYLKEIAVESVSDMKLLIVDELTYEAKKEDGSIKEVGTKYIVEIVESSPLKRVRFGVKIPNATPILTKAQLDEDVFCVFEGLCISFLTNSDIYFKASKIRVVK